MHFIIPDKIFMNIIQYTIYKLAALLRTVFFGQFVNGILDNIHKDLVRDNKMHKISFKPS